MLSHLRTRRIAFLSDAVFVSERGGDEILVVEFLDDVCVFVYGEGADDVGC